MDINSTLSIVDSLGDTSFSVNMKTFLFCILVIGILLVSISLLVHEKVSKNYEKAMFDKQLSDMKKDHEEQLKRHYKFRDELIAKNCKQEKNINILHELIDHSDRKIIRIEKERDDMAYSFKRRGKKIRRMEAILKLETPMLQLNNPNRSMSSIIKTYKFPDGM